MSRVKSVIVVILIIGVSGAGAIYGLNRLFQEQLRVQLESRLANVEPEILDLLRVRTFKSIQKLSSHSRDQDLSLTLSRLAPASDNASAEELSNLFKDARAKLVPVLTKLRKKNEFDRLLALTKDGFVVASVPDDSKFGPSLKGLPAVGECLQGVSRDGVYLLGGKNQQVAAVPLLSSSGNVSGCLMSADEFDARSLGIVVHQAGLQAVLFAGSKIAASTIDDKQASSLASQLDKKDIVRFGQLDNVPMFSGLKDAYAAKTFKVPGGTDPLRLVVALPLADLVGSLAKAQNMIFMALGALFVFGILLSLLLSGSKLEKDLSRLLDGVKLVAEGSSSSLNSDSFSGTLAELARGIQQLVTDGSGPAGSHADSPMFLSGALSGKVETPAEAPPKQPAPPPQPKEPLSTLDFESLLGESAQSAPEEQVSEPEPPAAVPAVPPAAVPPSQPDAQPKQSSKAGGPRVELPGELAGMFDGQEETREIEPFVPDMARPDSEPPAAKPAFVAPEIPPAPATPSSFDSGSMGFESPPDLDARDNQVTSSDYQPDATVIAQVPSELLNLAQSNDSEPEPAKASIPPPPAPPSALPKPPVAAASFKAAPAADAHFKEVFEQFVDTKKQCGESTAGLTFDRFAEKLRKNTSDLKARYKCRSVKFQVYVKNGKAALRATPVK